MVYHNGFFGNLTGSVDYVDASVDWFDYISPADLSNTLLDEMLYILDWVRDEGMSTAARRRRSSSAGAGRAEQLQDEGGRA
jgi:hypothetical protein